MDKETKVDKFFLANKGFIVHDGKVLVLHESTTNPDGVQAGKYGLPGGRLNTGEYFLDGLYREVREESGLAIEMITPLLVDEWRHAVRGEQWQIVGIFYLCKAISTDVILSNEHDAYLWIDPADHRQYPIIENEHAVFEKYLSQSNLVQ